MHMKKGMTIISAAALLLVVLLGACGDGTSNVPSEGTVENPVRIGNTPSTYSSTVAMGGDSYFVASGDAGTWTVAISNIDGNPDLYIFSDAGYSSPVCQSANPDGEAESCTVECTAACDIYIRVSGTGDTGASFTLSIVHETAISP